MDRKLGDLTKALDAFAQLIAFDETLVSGLPAGLHGRQGRAKIFADQKRRDDLEREALLLYLTLLCHFRWYRPADMCWWRTARRRGKPHLGIWWQHAATP